ncbi:sulfite exporter TauE/SafE family protein [Alteromonas antoniana]|uniref:sulfite exporter TauE/SafE family protein n=1 Tax=Alteromonas antoniana TaxID=2803813 RepID=UPI001C4929F4|nr:sulfite exporter TauE/SafE family protein [Alteromonas antoniana]
MNGIDVFSAFLIGIAGGVHCIGMCGGVISALRVVTPKDRNPLPFTLSYNTGRIFSYTVAGALTGAVGQMSASLLPVLGQVLALLSGLMLAALAAYLGQWWQGLRHIEAAGQYVWRRIQPVSKRFLPFRSVFSAFPYGVIWGWLPCGLVYSTLTWSLASGSALKGASIMLAFGLGTLPTLLVASYGVQWLLKGFRHPIVRQLIASSLLIYAVFLIYKAISSINYTATG